MVELTQRGWLTSKDAVFSEDNSSNNRIITLQKQLIKTMAGAPTKTSCRGLIEQLEILNFISSNQKGFRTNSSIHNIKTKNKHHLHRPNASLSFFPKSMFCAGIRIFKNLPPSVTILKNHKAAIRKCLRVHCFYCVQKLSMTYDTVL